MKKIVIGIGLGTMAGVIDLVPMIIQKLPFNADLSAFVMWIVIGFFISIVDLRISHVLKGIAIALLILLPNTFIIGWENPLKLVPITVMTIILGGLTGYFYNRFINHT
jgi:hypothetical protein